MDAGKAGKVHWSYEMSGKGHRSKFINRTGNIYGMLTVVSEAEIKIRKNGDRSAMWNCQCECGNMAVVRAYNLQRGDTKSCGCLKRKTGFTSNLIHGKSKTSEYGTWCAMKDRCYNENNPRYKVYGLIGIKVCDRWKNFQLFFEDMGVRPKGKSIERKDVNGDYEPSNCIWATPLVQSRNSRRNVRLTAKGNTMCISEWAEKTGINHATIESRVRRGWDHERSVFSPLMEPAFR